MSEIPFEYLLAATETTRGTAITTPARHLAVPGMITPKMDVSFPDENRGTLVRNYRSQQNRRWVEWETEDTELDLNQLHWWMSLFVRGGVTSTLVETGVRNWTFTPTINADNLASATMWWGDPNIQIWRSAFCMGDELTITADGSGTEGTSFNASGMGRQEATVTAPTVPAIAAPLSITPQYLDVWLETTSAAAYGTTLITNRVISVEHRIPTEMKYKFGPVGVVGGGDALTFRRVGRDKRFIETTIEMEVPDTNQYGTWNSLLAQPVRLRCRHNTAALIGATQRGFLQIDQYGPLLDLEWGEYEDVNRTIKFTIPSMSDAGLGADFQVQVQNTTTTL
jgi:hypothetical protein